MDWEEELEEGVFYLPVSITWHLLSAGVVIKTRAWPEKQRKGKESLLASGKLLEGGWGASNEHKTSLTLNILETKEKLKLKLKPSAHVAQFLDREKSMFLSGENNIGLRLYGSSIYNIWHTIKN